MRLGYSEIRQKGEMMNNDLISKQDTLKCLCKKCWEGDKSTGCSDWKCIEYRIIEDMPSAEPEIIRCKDCKHWRESTAFSYCDKLYGMGVLDAIDYMTVEDDYCSMAERRTDG